MTRAELSRNLLINAKFSAHQFRLLKQYLRDVDQDNRPNQLCWSLIAANETLKETN